MGMFQLINIVLVLGIIVLGVKAYFYMNKNMDMAKHLEAIEKRLAEIEKKCSKK